MTQCRPPQVTVGRRGGLGGGGAWHDAWMYCCQQLAAPIGLSPLTLALSMNPSPPPGRRRSPLASPPCALPLPLPGPSIPPYSPFLSLCRLCQRAPGLSTGPLHWPGASKWTPHTGGGGTLPNRGFWALGCPLAGSLRGWGGYPSDMQYMMYNAPPLPKGKVPQRPGPRRRLVAPTHLKDPNGINLQLCAQHYSRRARSALPFSVGLAGQGGCSG